MCLSYGQLDHLCTFPAFTFHTLCDLSLALMHYLLIASQGAKVIYNNFKDVSILDLVLNHIFTAALTAFSYLCVFHVVSLNQVSTFLTMTVETQSEIL